MKTRFGIFTAIVTLLLPFIGEAQTNTVPWYSIGTGFGVSASSSVNLMSSVGAGFIGTMQGTNTIIEGGFLSDTLFRVLVTSIADQGGRPKEYALHQNYPNPFNPTTSIRYGLPQRSMVTLSVFNTLGQQIETLVNGTEEAGYHEVKFDGSSLSSGVYFYRLQAGSFVQTLKLLLLK